MDGLHEGFSAVSRVKGIRVGEPTGLPCGEEGDGSVSGREAV